MYELLAKETVFLSRRNLLSLLSKLDRKANGEETMCTLIKKDTAHPVFPQTMKSVCVVAIPDDEYYSDRGAGAVHPSDESRILTRQEVVGLIEKQIRELEDSRASETMRGESRIEAQVNILRDVIEALG